MHVSLSDKDRAALERFVADLRELHGAALVATALTGEAAGAGYRNGATPLTTVVLLEEVTPEALRRTGAKLRRWQRDRIATPLMMDPTYLEGARDVFPLELLEISDHHLLLQGDLDPFADLAIDLPHLRLQVEEQLRGKMLHLWEAYLEASQSPRQLRRLLLETPAAFEVILRGMLRLRQSDGEQPRPDGPEELIVAVEREFEIPLGVLRELEAIRRGDESLPRAALQERFEAYLAEIRTLVRAADSL